MDYEQALLPKFFYKAGFFPAYCPAEQAEIDRLKEYIDTFHNTSKGLFIYGGYGTGKTHLACVVLKSLLDKGFTGRYYTMQGLFTTIDSANKWDRGDLFERLAITNLLVIDEFLAFPLSPEEAKTLYHLVDLRYHNRAPTIYCTNRKGKELLSLDKRIISVFGETLIKIHCDWNSHRESFL